jgi:hypothetical protein
MESDDEAPEFFDSKKPFAIHCVLGFRFTRILDFPK